MEKIKRTYFRGKADSWNAPPLLTHKTYQQMLSANNRCLNSLIFSSLAFPLSFRFPLTLFLSVFTAHSLLTSPPISLALILSLLHLSLAPSRLSFAPLAREAHLFFSLLSSIRDLEKLSLFILHSLLLSLLLA